ncbi:caspase family protein (plasmid) [Paraburkholderia sp. PREW-6R]|uniref:caspase family protein n=1 Tax=Paraburkholderia sp. PREW-6R TaxID=3141544 RepID=UPI0031F4CF4E
MKRLIARLACLIAPVLLSACAASSLPGFQNAYRAYNVPEPLVQQIKLKFATHGLTQASVARDNTGRIQLIGTYRDEDQVDTAFLIVQSIVGIKSTSPFYPEHVLKKRWDTEAGKALAAYNRAQAEKATQPVKRALVVGINHFADPYHLPDIQGADDAEVVQHYLERAGYRVTALLNQQATKANIEAAIARLNEQIRPNDDVFIYVSSHGNMPVPVPGDKRKMSIMAYDSGNEETVRSNDGPEIILHFQQHAVPDTLVQDLARKPSHVTRVVIDTCYSGDMLNDIVDEGAAYVRRTNGNRNEYEGISLASWTGDSYTSKGIRFSDDGVQQTGGTQKARTVIDRSRAGYNIITATSPNEESLGPKNGTFESPLAHDQVLKGSFFTQSLFAYLDHYHGQLAPAFRDASRFTSEKAQEVSKGERHQVPREWSTIPPDQNDLQ